MSLYKKSKKEILHYLQTTSKSEIEKLFSKANSLTEKLYQNKIHFRGIIEFSNTCEKNCYYCGLRRDFKIDRYEMVKKDILKCAKFCFEMGYGSIVLQSGEITTDKRLEFLLDIISKIKKKYNLGITLSLGELKKESLKELFQAGAHRYLLRIETSNIALYNKLHPKDHSFENRINTLKTLKTLGYQVGTGVMIGLPFQTHVDLLNDLLFFKDFDIDMIGMGPYVPHPKTPSFKHIPVLKDNFTLSLKMVALARLFLKDLNIAATTALQVYDKQGREKALLAGANILMPIVTPQEIRKNYLIYPDKPCIEDTKEKCFTCISARLKSIKKEMKKNEWGDSLHFKNRIKNAKKN